jgi:hypothetical protein
LFDNYFDDTKLLSAEAVFGRIIQRALSFILISLLSGIPDYPVHHCGQTGEIPVLYNKQPIWYKSSIERY